MLLFGLLMLGSIGNVVGVLEFCIKNNYFGGVIDVVLVKDKLFGKLGGVLVFSLGYIDGIKGILMNLDGNKFDLSSIKL